MTTEITVIEHVEDAVNADVDEENLSLEIVDLSRPLETRIKALEIYYKKEGRDNTIETINKLGMMYELSGTKILRKYLFEICRKEGFEPFLQSISARSLWSHNKNDDIGYQAVDIVYPRLDSTIGTPYKVEFVKILMRNEKYRDRALLHFCSIIDDEKINSDYRYKIILGLELGLGEEMETSSEHKTDLSFFIGKACLVFCKNSKNLTSCRILAGQYLLQTSSLSGQGRKEVEDILLGFGRSSDIDYNLRADATDVLLQLGSPEAKEIAKDLILRLGSMENKITSIYTNAQNVHTKEVEESVREALEFLHNHDILKIRGKTIALEYVENQVKILLTKEKERKGLKETDPYEKEDKIKISLNRIEMDRALYSKYNCNLAHILLRVWTYMVGHEHEDEMKTRLLEELYEMAGTCSSGFATRLINTISGFGDFSIKISWRDQIAGNFSGRLNARIRDMDDLRMQEKVLNEMTLESSRYEDRKNFLKFLRKNILEIRGELYEEFKNHISDADFDLYFRGALSMYETGQFK